MEEGKKRGLVIGINQYKKDLGFDPLDYAEADARDVFETLRDKAVAEFEEVVLVDENQTSTEVQRKLADILNKTEKDDLVLVYFAGHGTLDKLGRPCLVTLDTEIDKIRATSVPLDSINRMIEEAPCRGVVLIIDSCYSGTPGEATRSQAAEALAESFGNFSGPGPVPETIIISAAERLARERQDLRHGIFTKHLVEGLRKEADQDDDGLVSIEELFNYVHSKVVNETGSRQKPQKWPKEWGPAGKIIISKHIDAFKKREEEDKNKKSKLFNLLKEEELDAKTHSKCLKILKLPQNKLNRWQKMYLNQILELLAENIEPGDFLDTCRRIDEEEQRESQAPENEDGERRRMLKVDRQQVGSEQVAMLKTGQGLESAKDLQPGSQRPATAVPKEDGERTRMLELDRQQVGSEQVTMLKTNQGLESAKDLQLGSQRPANTVHSASSTQEEPVRAPVEELRGPVRDQGERDQVFVSYSHKDKKWLDELKKYLEPFKLKLWDDSRIKSGERWRDEIQKALEHTKAAILLISQDFLTSEYVKNVELKYILEEAKKGGVTMLWVAARHSTIKVSPLEGYQGLNSPDKPLDSFGTSDRGKELVHICEQINEAVRSNKGTQP